MLCNGEDGCYCISSSHSEMKKWEGDKEEEILGRDGQFKTSMLAWLEVAYDHKL